MLLILKEAKKLTTRLRSLNTEIEAVTDEYCEILKKVLFYFFISTI